MDGMRMAKLLTFSSCTPFIECEVYFKCRLVLSIGICPLNPTLTIRREGSGPNKRQCALELLALLSRLFWFLVEQESGGV